MYRVIAIVCGGLCLAACSSTPEWMNMSALKPQPIMDTVRFESTPPGADAKTSNGQSCRTPCALALPTEGPLTVTFTLNGYLPDSESLDPISLTGSETKMEPNPVVVELSPAPPPAKPMKPAKKPVAKKKVSAVKPAAPKSTAAKSAAVKPAPAATTAAPAPQSAASPWPTAPAPKQ
jgi:hypothetical protein